MHRFPSSWISTFYKLGGPKSHRSKKRQRGRRSRYENLEVRALLAGDLPQYVLVGWAEDDSPEQFVVSTEYTASNEAIAVLTLADGVNDVDTTLQELTLELRDGDQVLERQAVLVEFIDSRFSDMFYQERVAEAEAATASVDPAVAQGWLSQLNSSGGFSDLTGPDDLDETIGRLVAIAKLEHEGGDFVGQQHRNAFYRAVRSASDAAVADRGQLGAAEGATRDAARSRQLGDTGLLVGKEIAERAQSGSVEAAEALDSLFQAADSRATLFAGYGQNQKLLDRQESANTELSLGFVEEAAYDANDKLRTEFGGRQAMVQSRLTSFEFVAAMSFGVGVESFNAGQDASVDSASGAGDNSGTLTVQQTAGGDLSHGLLQFDISTYEGSLPEAATVKLQATSSTGVGNSL